MNKQPANMLVMHDKQSQLSEFVPKLVFIS